MSHVLSVNVGRPRPAGWVTIGRTAVDKTPVTGPVPVGPLGLDGDEVANRRHHGGPEKAVYAFQREDLDHWGRLLGAELPDGQVGENLTTVDLEVNDAEIGERWRIGDGEDAVLLEVTMFRTPCATFAAWMRETGHDHRAWLRRFAEAGRPGAYLRVLAPGTVRAGDAVTVVHRPGTGRTVASWFREVHPVAGARQPDPGAAS